MKSIRYFILVMAVALLASCDSPSKEEKKTGENPEDSNVRVLSSDMYFNCWFNEQTLQKGFVHSKPWASKTDSVSTDSYGFRGFIRDLGDTTPKAVKVNFWTNWKTTGSNAILVVGLDSLGTSKFWAGLDLKDSVKTANQWQQLHCLFNLPKNIKMDDRLTIYVWNTDKKELYVDDMEVKFLY